MNPTFWDVLQAINTVGGDLMMFAALGGGLAGYANREKIGEKIRRWFTRNHFPKEVGHPLDDAIQWDALIFTVSKTEVPFWVIEHLKPRHVGLIASHESTAAAEEIQAFAQKHQAGALVKTIDSPDDVGQSRIAARALVSDLRKQGCRAIAIDLTGGKVTMSLGAFIAAEESSLHSLYVSTVFDTALKKPDMRTAKILCVSRPQ
jgi:hypothetical protein